MIQVIHVTEIQAGLYAVALSIPGVYRKVRAIVRDGENSVWIDALNREFSFNRNGDSFEFAGE